MKNRLIAVAKFDYAGKTLHPGDAFDADEKDTHVLTTIGKAQYDKSDYATKSLSTDTTARKRTSSSYLRRDLKATEN